MNGLGCTCAGEAMWLYRASQGKISTTACHVRDLTNDCVGGTNLRQMETVSSSYGIHTGKVYQPINFDYVVQWVQTGHYGSHLNISYAPFVGTPYDRFRGGFRGNHDIYLSDKGKTSTTLRVGDPGATGFVDIPIALLKKAAGLLDVRAKPTDPYRSLNEAAGSGKCYAYVTPADPAAPTRWWPAWMPNPPAAATFAVRYAAGTSFNQVDAYDNYVRRLTTASGFTAYGSSLKTAKGVQIGKLATTAYAGDWVQVAAATQHWLKP